MDVIGNGSFSDPDGLVTSTYVEWGDSSTSNTGLNPSNVPHQYGSVGTFVSQLVLVTGEGEIRDACQASVEVGEKPPPPPPEEPGCELQVIEIVHDPSITLKARWWNGTPGPHPLDWDDGNVTPLFGSTGSETLEHNYRSSGLRDITFTVHGAEGKSAICRTTVEFKEGEEYGPSGIQIRLIAYFPGVIEIWSSDCQSPADGCRPLAEYPDCTLAETDDKGCLINPLAVEDIYIKPAKVQVEMGLRDAHGRDHYMIIKRWLNEKGKGEKTLCVIRPVVPKLPKGVKPHYPDVIVYIDDITFTFDDVHYQAFQTLDWYAMVGNE
ncbi:MAG: hypothetical protein GTO40_29575 [Deltaproteobacteria bacterium]|nr:hypothetical protein [Deltaproteobacteria bacterium]